MRETQLPMSSDVAGMPARVNGRTWTHSLVASSLRWPVVIASVVYYLAVLLFQRIEGAPQAAFGAYPDEASHYISGLLLRDYLLSGSLGSPIRYATEYYIHVPFFAIGYWPPLFYAAEALWMQCWGVSRTAVLAFVALIAAGTATLLFAKLRSEFGKVARATRFMSQRRFASFPSRMSLTFLAIWRTLHLCAEIHGLTIRSV